MIVLWRGGLHQRKKQGRRGEEEENAASIITRLHWHPLAVRCLAFSSNGAFLVSGGHEAVVIKWDLTGGASSSQRRTMLPRLRAPVSAVGAVSPRLLFALLSDRSLVLLSGAAFDVCAVIHGRLLRSAPPPATGLGAVCARHQIGLVLDPCSDTAVASARPGHLQWLAGNAVLDVTEENYVPLEPAHGGEPTESCATEVLLVAFSANGAVLSTYEALPIGDTGRCLRRVKWWLREDAQWRLVHCASAAHHSAFHALSFAPAATNLVAVTASAAVAWGAVDEETWCERFVWHSDDVDATSNSAACAFQASSDPDVLAIARGRKLSLWRWPDSPVALSPLRITGTELDEAAVQLCWPEGGALFALTRPAGDVLGWRGEELGEPAFRLQIGATTLAAQSAFVAACTVKRMCLLLHPQSGDVLRSLQLSARLCCAVVTARGLLLGLGKAVDHLERLWTSPRKENGDGDQVRTRTVRCLGSTL